MPDPHKTAKDDQIETARGRPRSGHVAACRLCRRQHARDRHTDADHGVRRGRAVTGRYNRCRQQHAIVDA